MTNIKVGDTVKTTIQGTVRLVDEARVNFYDVDKNVELWLFGDEVEKVAPPMPTAPGTILREETEESNVVWYFYRTVEDWKALSDKGIEYNGPLSERHIQESWKDGNLTIIS